MIGAPTGADPLSQDVSTKSLERTRTDSKPKPRDLKKYDPILRDLAAKLDAANDVEVSHLPGSADSLIRPSTESWTSPVDRQTSS